MRKQGNQEVISNALNWVRIYNDNFLKDEPINTLEVVWCSDCRHADRTNNKVWPYHCRRLGRSRQGMGFCRVVDKKFGPKQGYVFWEAR